MGWTFKTANQGYPVCLQISQRVNPAVYQTCRTSATRGLCRGFSRRFLVMLYNLRRTLNKFSDSARSIQTILVFGCYPYACFTQESDWDGILRSYIEGRRARCLSRALALLCCRLSDQMALPNRHPTMCCSYICLMVRFGFARSAKCSSRRQEQKENHEQARERSVCFPHLPMYAATVTPSQVTVPHGVPSISPSTHEEHCNETTGA
ncbi:hypothetical protein CYLTODRAFT_249536 [Cylindrobasidium torrendii FP15055 ss-10]|uniref:Uncharacterized protein n=1 Tax=Cylindrobasidium torrendii FP15055 ss-10 TaxID=1314674 RepID=A0A0D7BF57_9AGAR|nr:hypothetical protein CYLTODRAFT_249536 [Cylindrobasidium torrendii FP15055 ss-10]